MSREPRTAAGRRFVAEWPDRATGGPSEYAVGVALAIEDEAALLARPRIAETEPPSIADGPSVSDQSLAGLERLAGAATPGPWFQQAILVHGPDRGGFDIGPVLGWHDFSEADARLIVAMRNALPALLARRAPGDRDAEAERAETGLREAAEAVVEYAARYDYDPWPIVALRRALAADSRPEHGKSTANDAKVSRPDSRPEQRCTGKEATWCPVHGDCRCPGDAESGPSLEGPGCPLHDPDSPHPLADSRPEQPAPSYIEVRTTACHAGSDGDCFWAGCPQTADGEPVRSGRHCPLDSVRVPAWTGPVRPEEPPRQDEQLDCPDCDGTGQLAGWPHTTCSTCQGTGFGAVRPEEPPRQEESR